MQTRKDVGDAIVQDYANDSAAIRIRTVAIYSFTREMLKKPLAGFFSA
jgi:hypothetical protein